jgi:hypothetical protein
MHHYRINVLSILARCVGLSHEPSRLQATKGRTGLLRKEPERHLKKVRYSDAYTLKFWFLMLEDEGV